MKKFLLIMWVLSLSPLTLIACESAQPKQKHPPSNKAQANAPLPDCEDILDNPNSPYPKELGKEPSGY